MKSIMAACADCKQVFKLGEVDDTVYEELWRGTLAGGNKFRYTCVKCAKAKKPPRRPSRAEFNGA